jgi:hypothetical protein
LISPLSSMVAAFERMRYAAFFTSSFMIGSPSRLLRVSLPRARRRRVRGILLGAR